MLWRPIYSGMWLCQGELLILQEKQKGKRFNIYTIKFTYCKTNKYLWHNYTISVQLVQLILLEYSWIYELLIKGQRILINATLTLIKLNQEYIKSHKKWTKAAFSPEIHIFMIHIYMCISHISEKDQNNMWIAWLLPIYEAEQDSWWIYF